MIESVKNPLPKEIFDGPYKPYLHQQKGITGLVNVNSVLVDADCGLGKTFMAIQAIKYLKKENKPAKTIVVCPKSLIEGAWIEDIEKFGGLTYFNLRSSKLKDTGERYSSGAKKYKPEYIPIPPDKDVYIINYDILNKRLKDLKKQKFDIIIFDESSRLKNRMSQRYRAAVALASNIKRRWLLTGSPMPNGIVDLWSQFYLIDGGATLSENFNEFREKTHKKLTSEDGNTFWVETAKGRDYVEQRIRRRILRFKKEDVADIDFPKKKFIRIPVELSPEQRRVYDEIKNQYVSWLGNGDTVTATNALVELNKLIQITGGFVSSDRKIKIGETWQNDLYKFKSNPKLDALVDLVESIDGKVMIWAWFRHEVKLIAETLGCGYVMGNMPEKEFLANLNGFKHGDDRILVANPATIGHGHTLVRGHYMIYYSNSFDYELRHQTMDRIHRIGQTADMCIYYDIVAKNTIDEEVLKALKSKEKIQEFVTRGFKFI